MQLFNTLALLATVSLVSSAAIPRAALTDIDLAGHVVVRDPSPAIHTGVEHASKRGRVKVIPTLPNATVSSDSPLGHLHIIQDDRQPRPLGEGRGGFHVRRRNAISDLLDYFTQDVARIRRALTGATRVDADFNARGPMEE